MYLVLLDNLSRRLCPDLQYLECSRRWLVGIISLPATKGGRMPNFAAELMEKVMRVYEGASSLHSTAMCKLVLPHDHEELECLLDLWFKSPKLRIDCECLPSVSRENPCLLPKTIIWDGEYEYRFANGKWSKMKGAPKPA